MKNKKDAKRRENYLKTTPVRKFLGLRMREYNRLKKFGSEC